MTMKLLGSYPLSRGLLSQDAEPVSSVIRQVMRRVGSSVTIITTEHGLPFGMVATAMMSLSLEPPALAVGINRTASICSPLLERKAFCVNVLSRYDEDISQRFSRLSGTARFSAGDWRADAAGDFKGVPFLATALATLFCTVAQSMDSGSHCLVVGSIQKVIDGEIDDPLLYCDGGYGHFVKSSDNVPIAFDDRLALCQS